MYLAELSKDDFEIGKLDWSVIDESIIVQIQHPLYWNIYVKLLDETQYDMDFYITNTVYDETKYN